MAEPLVSHQSAIKRVLLAGVRTSIQNLFRQAEWHSSSAKHPRKTLSPSGTPDQSNVEAGLSPLIFPSAKILHFIGLSKSFPSASLAIEKYFEDKLTFIIFANK